VAQLAEGFGFDLADALAGDLEGLAYLFERVFGAVFEAEAHPNPLKQRIAFNLPLGEKHVYLLPLRRCAAH
jgi:hypothetical protein